MNNLLYRIVRKTKKVAFKLLVEKNPWYIQEFADCQKFWKRFSFDLQIVNLGSQSSFYGFDYTGLPYKTANWAIRPQSFPQDLAILKTYYSFLGPKAIVLIALCPYSSCFKSYKDINLEKYYTILHPGVIENFSLEKQKEIYQKKNRPYKSYKKQLLLGYMKGLKHLLMRRKQPETYTSQPMSEEMLEKDAKQFIIGWEKQFHIDDMDAPLPPHIREGRRKRIETLRVMLTFCRDRELVPVIVLPPMTKHLYGKMSDTFRNNYVYSFLEEVGIDGVRFLNYIDSPAFNDKDFLNSFFLNREGAKKFTRIVLTDLGLLS